MGGDNNTLIKSVGGFLGCYPVKEHVYNERDIFSRRLLMLHLLTL